MFSLVGPYPQNQRRPCTRTHHTVRLFKVEHRYGVGTPQLQNRPLHSRQQVARIQKVHQMGDDFGVGLAFKGIALQLQLLAQLFKIFNDAVVHQSHTALAEMRVGVVHHGRAMRGPAGVRNASGALDGTLRHLLGQLGHARGAAGAAQRAASMNRNATRVVAAVLQALQTLHQHRNNIAVRNPADNATHRSKLSVHQHSKKAMHLPAHKGAR